MVEAEFAFLGGSQTFVGVLLTIFLLCIFHDSNNFIDTILETIETKITFEISELSKQNSIQGINTSSGYKLLNHFLREQGNEQIKELQAEGAALLANISAKRNALQFDYANAQPDIINRFEKIKSSQEQTWAPLYCFIYCINLFICDEILRFTSGLWTDIVLSIVSLLTVYSVFYWITLWLRFYYKHIKKKEVKKSSKVSIKSAIFSFSKFCIFYFVPVFCLLFGVAFYLPSYFLYAQLICILIPIAYWGISKFKVNDNQSTHLFMFGHTIALLVVNVFFCSIVFFLYAIFPYLPSIPFNLGIFKLAIFGFTLVNGLILPFCMPLWSYKELETEMKTMLMESNNKARKIENEIQKDLENFAKKIPA